MQNNTALRYNPETTLEAAAIGIEAAANEALLIEIAKDQMVTTCYQLESLAEKLSGYQVKGMSVDAARMMDLHYTSILANIGLQSPPLPALESFGVAETRIGSTVASLEVVQDTLKAFWRTIKEMISKAFNAMANFLTQLFAGFKLMQVKITALHKAITAIRANTSAMTPQAPQPIHFPMGSELSLKGAFNDGTIKQGLANVSAATANVFTHYIPNVIKFYDGIASGATPAGDDTLKAEMRRMPFPGEIVAGFRFVEGAEGRPSVISRNTPAMETERTIDALSVTQMDNILREVDYIRSKFVQQNLKVKDIKRAVSNAMNRMEADANQAKVDDATLKAKRGNMSDASKAWFTPITQLSKVAYATCRTALAVCQLSIVSIQQANRPATPPAPAAAPAPAAGTPAPAVAPAPAPAAPPAPPPKP